MESTFIRNIRTPMVAALLLLSIAFPFYASAATTSALYPTADGSEDSASWTNTSAGACSGASCYVEVDETSGGSCTNSDGDTSYIESKAQGAAQTFDIDESGVPDGATITAVAVTLCYIKGNPGAANQFQARYCVDGSCNSSGVSIDTGASYSSATQTFSGLSISKGGSTDIEVGAIIIGDKNKNVRISQISTVLTYTEASDSTPPSAVSNLNSSAIGQTSVTLTWTAPGDDGSTGTASSYDVRYSTSAITDGNWSSATQATGEPTPSAAGASESMILSGLSAGTTYYFAIKTSDESANQSALSNVYSVTTTVAADTTAPAAVTDLSVSSPTSSSLTLSWTAPGDDGSTGTASSYDVRYSTSAITDGNWSSATQATGEPTPSAAGASESMTVSGLSANTAYYFAVRATDESANQADVSNSPSGTTSTSTTPEETDGGVGGQPSAIRLSGFAYPGSSLKVFTRGSIDDVFVNYPTEYSEVRDDGTFTLEYLGFLESEYFVGLQVVDVNGVTTGITGFSADLYTFNDLTVRDIVVPPTVALESTALGKGKELLISGYAAPNAVLEFAIDGVFAGNTEAEGNGSWEFATSTTALSVGEHYVKAKQVLTNGKESLFSISRAFRITVLQFPAADFNNDDRVDITDWSLFLFRWGSGDSGEQKLIDMDKDGVITIADLSIFLRALRI